MPFEKGVLRPHWAHLELAPFQGIEGVIDLIIPKVANIVSQQIHYFALTKQSPAELPLLPRKGQTDLVITYSHFRRDDEQKRHFEILPSSQAKEEAEFTLKAHVDHTLTLTLLDWGFGAICIDRCPQR